jgi:ABC-type multidrug transport system fused ATPase/permease subunit
LEPSGRRRRFSVLASLRLGREDTDVVIDDPTVSRAHAQVYSVDGALAVADLGSANGTFVNGVRLVAPVHVRHGDIITIGSTQIYLCSPQVPPPPPPPPLVPTIAETPPPLVPTVAETPTTTKRETLNVRQIEGFVLHSRSNTAGEAALPSVAAALRRARRRLSGFGSEPSGRSIHVYLVDPFPDPSDPSQIVASGAVIDETTPAIWMAVTAESPPEGPERSLAILYAADLPASAQLRPIAEGYGLWLGGADDPDPFLRTRGVPRLDEADGEIASAAALSFVRFLIERGGEAELRQFLSSAQPSRIDEASRTVFGTSWAALGEQWQHRIASGGDRVQAGQFLRLSVRYLRPHARKQAEIGFYMLLSLAFTIVLPFATRRLFDTALPSGEFSQVATLLGLLGIAFVISLLAALRQSYLSAFVGGAIVRDVRVGMFARLQALSARWFARRQQGDVLSRMFSDVGQLEAGLSETLREGLFQMLSLVVSSVIMLTLNPLLGVIVLLGAPVIGLVYRLMGKGAQRRSVAVQERSSALFAVAAENYSAQPVVKTFGLEQHESERFLDAANRVFRAQRRLNIYSGLFGLSVNLVVTALRLGVLALGSWLILEDRMSVGSLVAFLSIMGEVIGPVTSLTGLGQQIQQATGALVRVNEVLDEQPEIADRPQAVRLPRVAHTVELRDVTFSYSSERPTLTNLNIVIPAGQRVAFVGPSGAGKSSVLQLLMRNYDPDDGAVLFDGVDLRDAQLSSLRDQLGVVFQDTFLFDTTIRENIALGAIGAATDDQVRSAAKAAEVDALITQLPRGYDSLIGERGGRLSGGQRQRLAIARALIRDPAVLLLDEATSALDPRTERMINATLEKATEGRTTIAVTHRLASIVDYDQIYVLVDGQLVEQGRHHDLLASGGAYAALWSEQEGDGISPSFDTVEALSRLPLFATVDHSALVEIANRMHSVQLIPGEAVDQGEGHLYIVVQGRGDILQPALGGAMVTTARLSAGDSFGLSAILGVDSGGVLHAVERMSLLCLDRGDLARVIQALPEVAKALIGSEAERPGSGQRLSRVTIGRDAPVMAIPADLRSTAAHRALPS